MVIITPNLVSIHKIIVFLLRRGNFKNLLFLLFFYCSPLFVNNRTIGFLKIDNEKVITEFLFNLHNLIIKISILTKFHGHTFIFTEIMGLSCLSLFCFKMMSYRGGLKIPMQTCFMGIYLHITTKTPYDI